MTLSPRKIVDTLVPFALMVAIGCGAALGLVSVRSLLLPRIAFDDTALNVGSVPTGSKVRTTIVLENEGIRSLNVRVTGTSCSCTAGKLSSDRMAWGDRQNLAIQVEVPDQEGPFEKVVYLDTNDPRQSKVALAVHGVAQQLIRVAPGEITLGAIDRSALPLQKTIAVRLGKLATPKTGPTIAVNASHKWIVPSAVRLMPNDDYNFDFMIRSDSPSGTIREWLIVSVTDPVPFEIRLPITLRILSSATTEPAGIHLGHSDSTEIVTVQLVGADSGERWEVNEIDPHLSSHLSCQVLPQPVKGNWILRTSIHSRPASGVSTGNIGLKLLRADGSPRDFINVPVTIFALQVDTQSH